MPKFFCRRGLQWRRLHLLIFFTEVIKFYWLMLLLYPGELLPSLGVRRPSVRKHLRGRNVHLHGLTKCCYFHYDRLSNMAARGHKSLWLAEIFNDLLLRYYMEDGIENCHEWLLQSANQGPYQVLLLFVPTVRSRWLLLLKIEISSIVHCCFSISQNELKF